uniref:Uncharacterized protein n=1 Tax=Rhizophora mucronata TaxID=61149 RepID=A0A2P2PVX6_RHIMU
MYYYLVISVVFLQGWVCGMCAIVSEGLSTEENQGASSQIF